MIVLIISGPYLKILESSNTKQFVTNLSVISENEQSDGEKEEVYSSIGTEAEGGEKEEHEDQHPDQGLTPGCSADGLGHELATEEDGESPMQEGEEGREGEGEEGRSPVRIPAPAVVSKAEREEHELKHMPYRS